MKSTLRSTRSTSTGRFAEAAGASRAALGIAASLAALAALVALQGCASRNVTAEESVVAGVEHSDGLIKMASDDIKSKKRRGNLDKAPESPGSGGH